MCFVRKDNLHIMLEIENLHATVEGKEILRGVSLTIAPGEVHVLMGPNGSGKSTLSNVLVGNPKYSVTEGSITFQGKDLLEHMQKNQYTSVYGDEVWVEQIYQNRRLLILGFNWNFKLN